MAKFRGGSFFVTLRVKVFRPYHSVYAPRYNDSNYSKYLSRPYVSFLGMDGLRLKLLQHNSDYLKYLKYLKYVLNPYSAEIFKTGKRGVRSRACGPKRKNPPGLLDFPTEISKLKMPVWERIGARGYRNLG